MLGYKINYEIDNWSELIPIEEMWEKIPTQKSGVYFLYNENRKLIYIGKSKKCMRQRINAHCFQDLSGLTYSKDYHIKEMMDKRQETCFFSFTVTPAEVAEALEIFLINNFKPKFNTKT